MLRRTSLSLLFGAMHGVTPGETPIGLIAAMLFGLLFCMSLWYTGSLWWAIGCHSAWDWGESYFYGTSVRSRRTPACDKTRVDSV